MSDVVERFLQYVRLDTQSDEHAPEDVHPSTQKQHVLAELLAKQLGELGIEDVTYDKEHCYVYAKIPANDKESKRLGLIAHMDTSPEVSGANVQPRIIEDYDGNDIVLHEEKKLVMTTKEFPELKLYRGRDLIVTDGTTLLGADDKAGVAEIMSMAAYLMRHPEVLHGEIWIAFTPDEEIGCGTDFFDLEKFGANVAYTVDGGALGEIEYENFNAAGALVNICGRNTHPGDAKGKMINAQHIAMEYHALLPAHEIPEETEGYEGFYHLSSMGGSVGQFYMSYLIRDHSRENFEARKQVMLDAAEEINRRHAKELVTVQITDAYYNMREKIEPHMELIEQATAAMQSLGIPVRTVPIRGGTDGARLSFMGLPCPNLCTGGRNFHSCYEYICIQDMEAMVEVLIRLACGNVVADDITAAIKYS